MDVTQPPERGTHPLQRVGRLVLGEDSGQLLPRLLPASERQRLRRGSGSVRLHGTIIRRLNANSSGQAARN